MHTPVLYLFIGYPGAGKTTVAQMLNTITGATHIWADHERRKRYGEPTHSAAESKKLYEALNDEAAALLAGGTSVIFDTNFNFRADRDKLRAIAQAAGARTVILWITTPVDVAKQRAVDSENTRNGYTTPMSPAQFDTIARKLEPPTEDEKVIKIDCTDIDEDRLRAHINA